MEMVNGLNYILGQYIVVAVNEPSKYPKKPFDILPKAKKEQTEDEMWAVIESFVRKNNGVIIETNGN